MPTEIDRTEGISSVTIRTPLGNVLFLKAELSALLVNTLEMGSTCALFLHVLTQSNSI